MKELTLVVMAAGMGSRFGGLKQITPVDNAGNYLIDYSVYDAIRSGFTKVVFIIKEENLSAFKETIGNRLEDKIKVEYAFQREEDVPEFVSIPETRLKPWGTVHAVMAAKKYVDGPFVIINADNFYGYDSFRVVAEFLQNENNSNYQVSIPYPFDMTASVYGAVKRGVLYLDGDNVTDIVECSINYEDGKVIARPLDETKEFEIEETHPVSMNMFGFQKEILDDLEDYFIEFMKENKENLETCEALIPEYLRDRLVTKKLTLKYQVSKGLLLDMTFREDLDIVAEKIEGLKQNGEYKKELW